MQSGCLLVGAYHYLVDPALLHITQVGIKFGETDIARAGKHIHTAVVVKKQRRVMKMSRTAHHTPRPGRILGRIYVRFIRMVVGREQRVEAAVMVAQRCSPLPLAIHRPAVETIGRSVVKRIKHIAYHLPVDKVARMHNRTSGHQVHGGRHHIIIIPNPYHIRIRHVGPHQRISHGR